MFLRTLAMGLMAVALIVLASGASVLAAEQAKDTHTGTFVSVKGNQITMKDKAGKEHTHTLSPEAKIFGADGKECRVDDLREGQTIRVTTKADDKTVAVKIEVMRKKKQ
jgi:hypothetical protein